MKTVLQTRLYLLRSMTVLRRNCHCVFTFCQLFTTCVISFFICFLLSCSIWKTLCSSFSLSTGKMSLVRRSSSDTTSRGSTWRDCSGSHRLRRRTHRRHCRPPSSNLLSYRSLTTGKSLSMKTVYSQSHWRQWAARTLTRKNIQQGKNSRCVEQGWDCDTQQIRMEVLDQIA